MVEQPVDPSLRREYLQLRHPLVRPRARVDTPLLFPSPGGGYLDLRAPRAFEAQRRRLKRLGTRRSRLQSILGFPSTRQSLWLARVSKNANVRRAFVVATAVFVALFPAVAAAASPAEAAWAARADAVCN